MKKAELIFVPAPGIGHLLATLELAKRIIGRDDRILITVLVMKTQWDARRNSLTDSGSGIQLIDLPEVEPPSHEVIFKEGIICYITLTMEGYLPHVRNIVSNIVSSRSKSESVQVTGLIVDTFCASMLDIAKDLCLPSYIFYTSNVVSLSVMCELPARTKFEYTDSDLSLPFLVNPVPISVLPIDMVINKYDYSCYAKLALRIQEADGIIINTFSDIESYAINSFSGTTCPRLYPVGPVLVLESQPNPESVKGQSQKILSWLDAQPESSVVFLCFGSRSSFTLEQVKEIATALEHSDCKFLWSLRIKSSFGQGVSYNETTHADVFPDGFLEKTKDRGMVCGWSPQVEILAKKAVGGFVSHCGWNSILESLWYGVPIATWPIDAEQHLNAFTMVKESGLAVELKLNHMPDGDIVIADDIERAIKCLMEGDGKVRKKVKEMSEISRKSLMEGGCSSDALGRFIDLNF